MKNLSNFFRVKMYHHSLIIETGKQEVLKYGYVAAAQKLFL